MTETYKNSQWRQYGIFLVVGPGLEDFFYAGSKILQKAERLTQYSEGCLENPAFNPTRTLSYRLDTTTPGVPLHVPKGLIVLSGPASRPWFPVKEMYPILTFTGCPALTESVVPLLCPEKEPPVADPPVCPAVCPPVCTDGFGDSLLTTGCLVIFTGL
jgi:hypothetical protein